MVFCFLFFAAHPQRAQKRLRTSRKTPVARYTVFSAKIKVTNMPNKVNLYVIPVTALIECGVCVPSNYTGFYIKCNLLRNKEK